MKNMGVGDLEEVREPVDKSRWKLGAPFTNEGVEQSDLAPSLEGWSKHTVDAKSAGESWERTTAAEYADI